jgi:hypothetical protein
MKTLVMDVPAPNDIIVKDVPLFGQIGLLILIG